VQFIVNFHVAYEVLSAGRRGCGSNRCCAAISGRGEERRAGPRVVRGQFITGGRGEGRAPASSADDLLPGGEERGGPASSPPCCSHCDLLAPWKSDLLAKWGTINECRAGSPLRY